MTADDSLDAAILGDEPVKGIADRLGDLGDLDEDDAAARLRSGLEADGLQVPGQRGVLQSLSGVVKRLRGRTLVDDLGELPASFDVLVLHVPPGGTAALELERSEQSGRQVSLRALGFGFGGGRKLTIALKEGIPERASCVRIVQQVVLAVRRFAVGGDRPEVMVTTDVISYGLRGVRPWPDCPYCRRGDEPDPSEFDVDTVNAIDLRGHDAPVTREQSFTLDGSRKADIGFTVPVPGAGSINAGFQLEQHTSLTCSVAYTFPPGRCFIPYRDPDPTAALPYWAAT